MTEPTLVRHANGTYYLLTSPTGSADSLTQDVSSRIGQPVTGLHNNLPTMSSPGPGGNLNMFMGAFGRDPANMDAMRSVLRSMGDNSPELASDAYVRGRMAHLVYTEQVRMLQVGVPANDMGAKLLDAIERSYKYLPDEVVRRLRALITPESIAIIAGVLAVYAAAHFFGIGFIADVILAGLAVAAIGAAAVDALLKLVEFYGMVRDASTDADKEAAARVFADAVLTIGVDATAAVLMRRPLSTAGRQEMNAALARRISASGSTAFVGPAAKFRGVIMDMGVNLGIGPGAKIPGRAINATDDIAYLIMKTWDDVFFAGAHATENSLNFYRTYEATSVISPRALAVQMWNAGYRGGDVVLIACESGLNRSLVAAFHRELRGLNLDRPVGTIHAPRRAVNGREIVGNDVPWESFSFN
jgi:hypothetical protein